MSKRPVGRPPLKPEDRRSAFVRVRVLNTDARRLRRIAYKRGMTVSVLVRNLILRELSHAD